MSSKNRTSLVADSTLDWINTNFGTTETPIWSAAQFTPLKHKGRLPRLWRLVATGIELDSNGAVTVNLYNGDKTGGLLATATIPSGHGGSGNWYLTAEVAVRLSPGSTNIYIISAYGFIVAGDGSVWPFVNTKPSYDPTLDSILTCTMQSTNVSDSVVVGTVALEALN